MQLYVEMRATDVAERAAKAAGAAKAGAGGSAAAAEGDALEVHLITTSRRLPPAAPGRASPKPTDESHPRGLPLVES